jgi:hypothetical protein
LTLVKIINGKIKNHRGAANSGSIELPVYNVPFGRKNIGTNAIINNKVLANTPNFFSTNILQNNYQ